MHYDGSKPWRSAGIPKGSPPSLGGTFGGLGKISQLEYNPLDVSVGSTLKLHGPDFNGLEVEVEQVLETVMTYERKRYHFIDYVLIGPMTPETAHLADRDGNVRLRLRGSDDGAGGIDLTVFQAQHLEEEATRTFENLASSAGSVSLRSARGGYDYGFERSYGAQGAYSARRTVVGCEGSEGSTTTRSIEYLDYCREQQDDDGSAYQQWALVEHNPDTHDMITLFGWSITPHSVERVGIE